MNKLILVFILLFVGCSSTPAESKSKWVFDGAPKAKREWRYCDESIDGPSFHDKGFCYDAQMCRRRKILKDVCKDVLLFCSFGDSKCLAKQGWPKIKRR